MKRKFYFLSILFSYFFNADETMIHYRPRRNRRFEAIRRMVQETHLTKNSLVLPLFVLEYCGEKEEIPSLKGTFRHSLDSLLEVVEEGLSLGIYAVVLFPVVPIEKRDPYGKEALNPNSQLCKAIKLLKERFPELCVMADIALDPYTSHGHDGVLGNDGLVDNDRTVDILCKASLVMAQAGADMVAPSDMMDGRVFAIRKALDTQYFFHVGIHSYCAKYASCFYSPFRDALGTSPIGDKKSYQMDPANGREALKEALMDEEEGADLLMIKPALHYLDIIYRVKEQTHLPVSAYHVSGEYALIQAAAEKGLVDFKRALWETTLSIKRAGADLIITYGALELARLIEDHNSSYVKEIDRRVSEEQSILHR
jgi:porphobilinogen synthase